MQAKAIIAALLFLCAGPGVAEPQTWRFTYTGFDDVLAGRFDPERVLSGKFTGEDANGDGAIDYEELSTMWIYGERNYKGCQGEESPYFACGVGPFHFVPENDLSARPTCATRSPIPSGGTGPIWDKGYASSTSPDHSEERCSMTAGPSRGAHMVPSASDATLVSLLRRAPLAIMTNFRP